MYLENYKKMRPLSLILKKFLAVNNLNCPYKGGLSSYSLNMMIIAFLNEFMLMYANVSISLLLTYFLDFFAMKFDEKTTGILIRGG